MLFLWQDKKSIIASFWWCNCQIPHNLIFVYRQKNSIVTFPHDYRKICGDNGCNLWLKRCEIAHFIHSMKFHGKNQKVIMLSLKKRAGSNAINIFSLSLSIIIHNSYAYARKRRCFLIICSFLVMLLLFQQIYSAREREEYNERH